MATDTLHIEGDGLEVHKVVVGPYDNNVFVLRCTETGDAVLLDAANEHDKLLELCRASVTSVLETHGHWTTSRPCSSCATPATRYVTAEDAATCSPATTRCSTTTA